MGQKLRALRDNLTRLADGLERPAALLLQEAGRGEGWTIPGYTGVRAPAGLGAEYDNCVILVRKDGEILDQGAWKVPGGRWQWNGNNRAPRIWPWTVVRFGPTILVLVDVHQIPKGPDPHIDQNTRAWRAGHDMLAERVPKLAARWPGAVVVVGGDFNTTLDRASGHPASLRNLAAALDATPRMRHIDGFLVIGGESTRAVKLDARFGSDGHKPVHVTVRKP